MANTRRISTKKRASSRGKNTRELPLDDGGPWLSMDDLRQPADADDWLRHGQSKHEAAVDDYFYRYTRPSLEPKYPPNVKELRARPSWLEADGANYGFVAIPPAPKLSNGKCASCGRLQCRRDDDGRLISQGCRGASPEEFVASYEAEAAQMRKAIRKSRPPGWANPDIPTPKQRRELAREREIYAQEQTAIWWKQQEQEERPMGNGAGTGKDQVDEIIRRARNGWLPNDELPISDINTGKLFLTIFKDETGSEKFKGEHTLPEWQHLIQTANANKKEKLLWLKGAEFGDTLSDGGCYRTNENLKHLTAVVVEHDKGDVSFDQAMSMVSKAGLRCLGYTSPSYRKDTKERWRLVFPLSRNTAKTQHDVLVAIVNGILGGKLADDSWTLSRAYYFGSVNNNPDHRAEIIDGKFLDIAISSSLFADRIYKDGSQEDPKSRADDTEPKTKWDSVNDRVDEDEIIAALAVIKIENLAEDTTYQVWFEVASALRHNLGDDGFELFDHWSATATKVYNAKQTAKKWREVKGVTGYSLGTIFHYAYSIDPEWKQKWQDSKPKPLDPAQENFTKNTQGAVLLTQGNIRLALKKLGVIVRYNLFEDRPTIEGLDGFDSLNDAAMDRLWLTIDQKFKFRPTKEFFWTVVFDESRLHPFHPVCEYLGSLKWDGTKRIDSWLIDYGSAEDTAYIRAIGALFLVAAVRRVRSPGCKFDEMIVLQSSQGLDKSSALTILAVHPEWFSDDLPLNSDSKKTIERLRGRWIVEAAELKGMRYGDVEHLKAFLSRTVDRARMSYDRATTELKRQCVICGTTNHNKFLRDQTGNRRFWPAREIKFDLAKLKQDRDQLWAEAAAREAEGVSIRLPKELWADAGAEQEEHAIEEPWIEIIRDHLTGNEGKLLCSDAWLLVEVKVAQRTQVHNERLGIAMKACGWVRRKQRFGRKVQWAYVPENTPKGAALLKVAISIDDRGEVMFIKLVADS